MSLAKWVSQLWWYNHEEWIEFELDIYLSWDYLLAMADQREEKREPANWSLTLRCCWLTADWPIDLWLPSEPVN